MTHPRWLPTNSHIYGSPYFGTIHINSLFNIGALLYLVFAAGLNIVWRNCNQILQQTITTTVSDLIRGELKGVNPLKYLTSQFWMVRRRSCKNQFWLKSESIMVCHLKGTFLGSNSTSQNRIGL